VRLYGLLAVVQVVSELIVPFTFVLIVKLGWDAEDVSADDSWAGCVVGFGVESVV